MVKRREFAKKYITYPNSFWNKVLFSDECKFELYGSSIKERHWKKFGSNNKSKIKNFTFKNLGKNVMVWACFSYNGVGNLEFIDGIMDKYVYCNILANNIPPSLQKLNLKKYVFQQDNDPKHTSNFLKEYFKDKSIEVLDWPSQSPDLNPIENLWAHIKKELRSYRPKNVKELKSNILEIWNSIDVKYTQNLVNSMPKRIIEVLRENGGNTKY